MNKTRARYRSGLQKNALGLHGKGRLDRLLGLSIKVIAIIALVSVALAAWSFWRLAGPQFGVTSVVVAVGILAAALIIWLPKLQILQMHFKSGPERFTAENEARKTVATVVGGLAIFMSFYTAQRQLGVQQQVQFTDRYTKAIDEIAASDENGRPNLAVRVGGLYVLEQIMDSSEAQHASILEVLCAYIRDNSQQAVLRPDNGPRADTRVALTILGRRNRELEVAANRDRRWRLVKDFFVHREFLNDFTVEFVRPRLDLSSSDLKGVDLSHLVLSGADFSSAKLSNCRALFGDLSEANFEHADLSGCLIASELNGARFANANLVGAVISGKVSGATFQDADVGLSIWVGADLDHPRDIQTAKNWQLAFYSPRDMQALGLPADHNLKLLQLIGSRDSSTAAQIKIRLALVLQNLKEMTQSLQDLRDNLVDPQTSQVSGK